MIPATAVQTIARLLDVIAGDGPRPIAATLHVGSQRAADLLADAAGWRRAQTGRAASVFGVRIVVGWLQGPTLGELDWRLLNSSGDVIAEGIVTP